MTNSTESGVSNDARCDSGLCIELDVYVGDHLTEPLVRFHSTRTGTVMQARASEVIRFFAEVRNGEWDHVITDLEIVAARQLPSAQFNDLVDAAEHKAR